MGNCVCMGAELQCSMGSATSALTILPTNLVNTTSLSAATVMDYVPLLNIMSFGQCSSPSNPLVAAATAAALGVLTPQACIPCTVSPWTPGSATVKIGNMNALDDASSLVCMWAGSISINDPGEQDVSMDN